MFLLARTDPNVPKHKGISYFLLEMNTPGINVRELPDITGDVLFNEVFFDNVRVPAKNLVGEENRGWYIAATTLDFERAVRHRLDRPASSQRGAPAPSGKRSEATGR